MSDKRRRNQQRRARRKRMERPTFKTSAPSRCDFCCSEYAEWSFPCARFGVAQVVGDRTFVVEMGGEWLACDRCRDLVERDEWGVLAEYSVRSSDTGEPYVRMFRREAVAARIRVVQARFRKHRTGPPRRREQR